MQEYLTALYFYIQIFDITTVQFKKAIRSLKQLKCPLLLDDIDTLDLLYIDIFFGKLKKHSYHYCKKHMYKTILINKISSSKQKYIGI